MSGHIDEKRLLAFGLGEPPAADEAEHLAACPACAAGPAADARLWAQLRQLQPPAPPVSLATVALARFRTVRAVRHRPREVVLGGLIVVALMALVCLWALRVFPGALVTVALALPRWSSLVATGNSYGPVLAAVLPVAVVSAAVLLAGVGVMLRRLTAAPAK